MSRTRSRAIRLELTVNADFSITTSRIPCSGIKARLRASYSRRCSPRPTLETVCRAEIRKARWEEVQREALVKVTYDRNTAQLDEQLHRRQAAAAMRMHADDIESRTEGLDEPARTEAIEWAAWIRQHADRTDPLNGPLRLVRVRPARGEELEPHMNGWSPYGPYRR